MKREMNNKGFSLVELIIVVAIMAVLVGVLAPQYIKYLDKSKAGTDRQLADNLRQAITTTILDPTISGGPAAGTAETDIPDTSSLNDFWKEVYAIMGVADGEALEDKLKYTSSGTGVITYAVDANMNVTVKVTYSAGNAYNITIQ